MNPGAVGQGPRRAEHRDGRRSTRGAASARRDDRRRYGRQYRHRAGDGRQCAGHEDGHRHPGNADPGEEGHAADARRRTGRGPGRRLQEPQQLCEDRRASGRTAGDAKTPTARSGPTSSTMSPTATRMSAPPARKSGSRPTARSTVSSARSAPAARWPGSAMALKERKPDIANRACRHARRGAVQLSTRNGELKAEGNSITEGIGQGRITANLEGFTVDHAFLIPDDESVRASPSACSRKKGWRSARRPAST